jgi:hypothetical protein
MDGRLIFLHHCWRTKALGRWLKGDPAQLEGRPARGRTYTIPKSPERQPRKADAGDGFPWLVGQFALPILPPNAEVFRLWQLRFRLSV